MTRLLAVALLILTCASCAPDGATDPSTTPGSGASATRDGLTFVVYDTDDGARLRIRTGDELVARLSLTTQSAPPWRVAFSPNPRILHIGEWTRVARTDSDIGDPYDEISFQAVGSGATRIDFEQSGSGRTLSIAITVGDG